MKKTPKIIPKQRQFKTAIKRKKICNIKRLLNDPEVDPAIDNNAAISKFLDNWEIFQLLNSSDRVDPFENYRDNLVNSISRYDNQVFNYLRKNDSFKFYITDCLLKAIECKSILFEDLYANKDYNQKRKDNDYIKLLRKSYEMQNENAFIFLLKINKTKEIKLFNNVASQTIPNKMLIVLLSDSRLTEKFDVDASLENFIIGANLKNFKTLVESNMEYNLEKALNFIYNKMSRIYYLQTDIEKNYNEMVDIVLGNKNAISLCQKVKNKNGIVYSFFKKKIDLKLMATKISEF